MYARARGLAWLGGLGLLGAGVAYACLPSLPAGLCGNGHIDAPGEECDPGDNANPGCNAFCEIVCPGYLDNTSNHCYFQINGDGGLGTTAAVTSQPFGTAANLCAGENARAHLLTLVDDNELNNVVTWFAPTWSGGLVWAGLDQSGGGNPYHSTAVYEPGWDVPSNCSGCFLHGVTSPGSNVPMLDGGAEAGNPLSIVDTKASVPNHSYGTMGAVGQNARAQVVCEREPVGSRSTLCNAPNTYCFNVLAPLSSGSAQSKTYLYVPTAMTSSAAAKYCADLSDAGSSSSLVVFESRAEREQVIYELSQMPLLHQGPASPPTGFWIGLRTELIYPPEDAGGHDTGGHDGGDHDGEAREAGAQDAAAREGGALDAGIRDAAVATEDAARHGKIEWVWADDAATLTTGPTAATAVSTRPSVWGASQPPRGQGAGVYAYVSLSNSYDTGLVYVDTSSSAYAVVCQLH